MLSGMGDGQKEVGLVIAPRVMMRGSGRVMIGAVHRGGMHCIDACSRTQAVPWLHPATVSSR